MGTQYYKAPETWKGTTYKGKQADLFALGVVLFRIVQGFIPFNKARKDDYKYGLLIKGRNNQFWTNVKG